MSLLIGISVLVAFVLLILDQLWCSLINLYLHGETWLLELGILISFSVLRLRCFLIHFKSPPIETRRHLRALFGDTGVLWFCLSLKFSLLLQQGRQLIPKTWVLRRAQHSKGVKLVLKVWVYIHRLVLCSFCRFHMGIRVKIERKFMVKIKQRVLFLYFWF